RDRIYETVYLATAGFRVVVAENGAAGLDTFLSMKDEICLVIADVIMPAMGGQEMAAAIREIKADVKIRLTSGYSDSVIKLAGKYDFPFVRKPFLIQDVFDSGFSAEGSRGSRQERERFRLGNSSAG